MSKEIDEKVVEMRFDNDNFEKNVATSMKTLESLKKSLNFDGAAKGLMELDTQSKNVKFSVMSSAIEGVSQKFSALEVVGITALAKITDRAMDAGERLVKSLSLDQVTAGWSKYADKTSAVQTIMAATAKQFEDEGEQMEYVTDQLERLNWYTDETSYNFIDMVNNIGKFTSNNIDLDTSVTAMQGIANWAAISGANANEASRAMYNLAQALATGAVKLIDWKSIENANMATAEFKDMALQTAAAVGTLRDNLDGTFTTLDGNEVTVANFNAALQDGWFTSEVLLDTLGQYGEFSTVLNQVYKDLGDGAYYTTSDILDLIDAYKENADVVKEVADVTGVAAKDVSDMFEELGKDEYELGRKSFQAGQEAKTFADAINAVKDAVSTKWMVSFEKIFGNLEEAKEVWGGFYDFLDAIFVQSGVIRNKVLDSALGKSFKKVGEIVSDVTQPIKETAGAIEKVTESLEDLDNIANSVIAGAFGNGADRVNALTEAGYNYYKVQNKVNEKLGCSFRYTEDMSEAQEASVKTTEKQIELDKERIKQLMALDDEALEAEHLTKDQIEAVHTLQNEAKKLGMTTDDFADSLDEINGRWILLDSFSNIGETVLATLSIVQKTWREFVYGSSDEKVVIEKRAERLFKLIEGFHRFTEAIKINADQVDEYGTKANKLYRSIKGVFAIVKSVLKIVGTPFRLALQLVKEILDELGISVLDVTAWIGDHLLELSEWIDGLIDFEKIGKKLKPIISWFIENVPLWIEAVSDWVSEHINLKDAADKAGKSLDKLSKKASKWYSGFKSSDNKPKYLIDTIKGWGSALSEWIEGHEMLSKVVNKTSEALGGFIDKIEEWFGKFLEAEDKPQFLAETILNGLQLVIDSIGEVFDGICDIVRQKSEDVPDNVVLGFAAGLLNAAKVVWEAISSIVTGLIERAKELLGIHSPSTVFIWIGTMVIAGLIAGLTAGWDDVWTTVSTLFSGLFDAISKFIKNSEEYFSKLNIGDLFAGGILISFIVLLNKLIGVLDNFSKPFSALAGIKDVFVAMQKEIKSEQIKNIGAGIAYLAGSLIAIAVAATKYDLKTAGIALALIGVGLVALMTAAHFLGGAGENVSGGVKNTAIMLLAMSVGISLLSKSLVRIAEVGSPAAITAAAEAIKGIGIVVLAISGVMSLLSTADIKFASLSFLAIAGTIFVIAKVIKSIADVDWSGTKTNLTTAGNAIGMMGLVIAALVAVSRIAGKDLLGLGVTLFGIASCFAILTQVAIAISDVPWDEFKAGMKRMAWIAAFVEGLLIVTTIADKLGNGKVAKLGGSLVSMALAVAILAFVAKSFSDVNPSDMLLGVAVVGIFMLLMRGLIEATMSGSQGQIKGLGKTMISVATAIGILAAIALLLGKLSEDDIDALFIGAGFVAAFSILMIGLVQAANNTKDAAKTLVGLALIIGVLAGVVIAMSYIKDTAALGVSAGIVLALLGMLTLIVKQLNKMNALGTGFGKSITMLIVLAACVAALGLTVNAIAKNNWGNSIAAAAALIMLLASLVVAVKMLSDMNKANNDMLKTVGMLLVLSGVMLVLSQALGTIGDMNFGQMITKVIGLSLLLAALVVATNSLKGGSGGAAAAASLLIMSVAIIALAAAFKLLEGVGFGTIIGGMIAFSVIIVVMTAALAAMLVILAGLSGGALILLAISAAFLVFAGALYVTGLALPLIGEGLVVLGEGLAKLGLSIAAFILTIAGVKSQVDDFASVMVTVGASILKALAMISLGMVDAAVGAVVLGAGALILGAGLVVAGAGMAVAAVGLALLAGAIYLTGAAVSSAITSIMNALVAAAQSTYTLGYYLVAGFALGIIDGVGAVMDAAGGLVGGIITTIAGGLDINSPSLLGIFWGLMTGKGLELGLTESQPGVETAAGGLFTKIKNIFSGGDLSDTAAEAGKNAGSELTTNAADSIDMESVMSKIQSGDFSSVTEMFGDMGSAGGESFTTNASDSISIDSILSKFNGDGLSSITEMFGNTGTEAGTTCATNVAQGIGDNTDGVNSAVTSMATDAASTLDSKKQSFYDSGMYVALGYANGIKNNAYVAVNAAIKMATDAINAVKAAAGEGSPAKQYITRGMYVAQGYSVGIDKYAYLAEDSAENMARNSMDSLSAAVSESMAYFSDDLDLSPTITPVVDLTDVKNGVGQISTLFDNGPSLGVTASIRDISRNGSNRQNDNSDVVAAVNRLNKKLDNVGGTTNYTTIDGVSYGDGTEVSDAVGALVRAIRIEGRS